MANHRITNHDKTDAQQLSSTPKLILLAVVFSSFFTVGVPVLIHSWGEHAVVSYALTQSSVFPKWHLPLADSDCYKWANVVRGGDWVDRSERDDIGGTVLVQWALPTRAYLASVIRVLSVFFDPQKAESWGLFFAMPVLSVLVSVLLSAYCVLRFGSLAAAIVLPPAIFNLPAITPQIAAGRPDHHGLILAVIIFFVLSLGSVKPDGKGWIFSSVFAALGVWISPLNVVPVIGVFGAFCFIYRLISPVSLLESMSGAFWVKWGGLTGLFCLALWLFDYAPRGGPMHMETVNPVWAVSIFGGGLLLGFLHEWRNPRCLWKLLVGGGLAALAPVAILNPDWFWTGSNEVRWLLKEVSEMRPGDEKILFGLAPFVFLSLLLIAGATWGGNYLPLAAVVTASFYVWQVRWLPVSLAVCAAVVGASLSHPEIVRWRGLLVAALAFQAIWGTASTVRYGMENVANPKMRGGTFNVAGFSAFTAKLAKSRGETSVLSSPNMTSGLYFFEGVRGVGSVYWESKNNLAFSSKVFGSVPETDNEAAELMKKHGIRLLAVNPQLVDTGFAGMAGNWDRLGETLVVRLATGRPPSWLQPVFSAPQPWPGLSIFEVR